MSVGRRRVNDTPIPCKTEKSSMPMGALVCWLFGCITLFARLEVPAHLLRGEGEAVLPTRPAAISSASHMLMLAAKCRGPMLGIEPAGLALQRLPNLLVLW